tara:strand:+ start:5138 stop:5353 length:216 start_codon:yes stop_codon:yes gene_type:complete
MFAIDRPTLKSQPAAHKGDTIKCPRCNDNHTLECGTDPETQKETSILLFYKCGDSSYIAAIDNHLVTGDLK